MDELDTERCRANDSKTIYTFWKHVVQQLEPYNYMHESRVLMQLANFASIVWILTSATTSAVGIINPTNPSMWHQQLLRERNQQIQFFMTLLEDLKWMSIEMGDENQRMEILTRMKHGIETHGDVLTRTELEVISLVYDNVVRLSNVVVVGLPEWFAISAKEWDKAEISQLNGGEEECLLTAAIWSGLNHPNVQKLFGACHTGTPFMIHQQSIEVAAKSLSWKYILEFAHGLRYLNDCGVTHNNLVVNQLRLTYRTEIGYRSTRIPTGGILSGIGLVRLQEKRRRLPKLSEINCNDRENQRVRADTMKFGLAIVDILDQSFVTRSTSHYEPWRRPLHYALSRTPAIRPAFVEEDVWNLLVGMCNEDSSTRITMQRAVHQIGRLAIKESRSRIPEGENDEIFVRDVDTYVFSGESIRVLLDDAQQLCADINELYSVNQSVLGRLTDIFEQFQATSVPLGKRLLDDFSLILTRFISSVEQRTSLSRMTSMCVSHTVAGKNYSIHHDIDRLLLGSPNLSSEARVHRWQPRWKKNCRQQLNTLQACLEKPEPYLDVMMSTADRRQLIASLMFEARYQVGSMPSTLIRSLTLAGHLTAVERGLPKWFIPPHQVELGRHIADGSFGAVYEGTWLDTDVVVKQVLAARDHADDRAQFRREVDLWFSLNHDHLIKHATRVERFLCASVPHEGQLCLL